MKRIFTTIAVIVSMLAGADALRAGTFTTKNDGSWSDPDVWRSVPSDDNCSPAGNHTYEISHQITVDCGSGSFKTTGNTNIVVRNNGDFRVLNASEVSGNFTFNIEAGGKMYVDGDVNLGGSSFTNVDGELYINGDATADGNGYDFDCNGNSGGGKVRLTGVSCNVCKRGIDGCIDSAAFPLPVTMMNYTIQPDNGGATIEWTTIEEINNDRFIVEASNDLNEWYSIGEVKGAGTTNELQDYAYSLESLEYSYVRIRQVDYDGDEEVFDVLAIPFDASQFQIYPTQAGENGIYYVSGPCQAVREIEILDNTGQQISTPNFELLNSEKILFTADQLKTGIYLVKVQATTVNKTFRIVVQ